MQPNISPQYGLCLDTTSPTLGLAIGSMTGACRMDSWELGHGLSAQLHEVLQTFIMPQQWSELAWIAVMQGPGSFTGTRIGIVTARTLAQQLQIPLYGFSNLAIAAWLATAGTNTPTTVAVTIPGQRDFVYGAIYRVERDTAQLEAIESDRLLPITDWHTVLDQHKSLDSLVKQDTQGRADVPEGCQAMLELGWHLWQQHRRPHWESVLPYYG